jgi:hypothetical protein
MRWLLDSHQVSALASLAAFLAAFLAFFASLAAFSSAFLRFRSARSSAVSPSRFRFFDFVSESPFATTEPSDGELAAPAPASFSIGAGGIAGAARTSAWLVAVVKGAELVPAPESRL